MIHFVRAAARKLTIVVAAAALGAAVVTAAATAAAPAPGSHETVSVRADGVTPRDTGCC